jgi:hypothetical protein
MGVIRDVIVNVNNEVTGATVLKGKTRELTKRNVSCLIPLLSVDSESSVVDSEKDFESTMPTRRANPSRKTAIESRKKTANMLEEQNIPFII